MYEVNEALERIAEKVMQERADVAHLKAYGCRIAYLMSSEAKRTTTRITYADCEKVKEKYKALIPYDFIITFYEPQIAELDADQLELLMWHELKHAGFDGEKCKIIPHDINDFKDIVRAHGVDWNASK